MGNSTGKLANSLHLLRLAELLLESSLLGNILENRQNAFLSRNVHALRGIERGPLFTGLGTKRDFQVAKRSIFVEFLDERSSVIGPLPKFELFSCVADHVFALVSCNAKEALVHINLPALRSGGDNRG